MPWDFGFEIAQAWPLGDCIQVDLGYSDAAPAFGLSEGRSGVIEDGGNHPVAGDVFVSAADKIDMIFARPRSGEQGVTTPDGPGDDFRTAVGKFARDFGKKAVITDHEA